MEKAYHKLQKFCMVFHIPIWCTNVMLRHLATLYKIIKPTT
jgi:hypothetical protein